jgi:hypothetical protein
MNDALDWRTVYDFWFPPGLDDADLETAPPDVRLVVWRRG